jgi:hypothetical protein
MQIKINFEGAGALEKSTVKKEEGNKVIIIKDDFPYIEYDEKNIQYPNVIGSDIESSGNEILDATKQDERAIEYFENLLEDFRKQAQHRLSVRELEEVARLEKEKKEQKNQLPQYLPMKKKKDDEDLNLFQ